MRVSRKRNFIWLRIFQGFGRVWEGEWFKETNIRNYEIFAYPEDQSLRIIRIFQFFLTVLFHSSSHNQSIKRNIEKIHLLDKISQLFDKNLLRIFISCTNKRLYFLLGNRWLKKFCNSNMIFSSSCLTCWLYGIFICFFHHGKVKNKYEQV